MFAERRAEYRKYEKEFLRTLSSIDDPRRDRECFRDFCSIFFYELASLTAPEDRAATLRKNVAAILEQYKNKEEAANNYKRLYDIVAQAVQNVGDFLGPLSTDLGVLDSRNGQFFSPYSLCLLMAQLVGASRITEIQQSGFTTVADPTAGSGATLIAAAEVLRINGLEPMTSIIAHAADVSSICYHMCFIQLTLAGVPALVEHMDSLSLKRFDAAWTPMAHIFWMKHGHLFPPEEEVGKPPPLKALPIGTQLSLFQNKSTDRAQST